MDETGFDARVRALRPPKRPTDPWRPIGTLLENERAEPGRPERCFTIFLAGAECRFTCVFCDLWRSTVEGLTPVGAIPSQIERALDQLSDIEDPDDIRLKLYNASNFFDRRAVPPEDDPRIVQLALPFGGVTVENHPRLVGERCFRLAEALDGRLEIALGLETIDHEALARLNKKSRVEDFDRAVETLRARDIDVRAFVLLGAPFESCSPVEGAVKSAAHAFAVGARFVALNPVRKGNGYMDRLETEGAWCPPTLAEMEEALARTLTAGEGIAVVDTWELEGFADCPECYESRARNLADMNATGVPSGPAHCDACGAGD